MFPNNAERNGKDFGPMKIWRPYTQMQNAFLFGKVVSASGAYLKLSSGEKCLDGISSWWLTTHGHNHPVLVEAIQKKAEEMDQIVFANFTHESAEELAEMLEEILPPELSSLFFSDNGSTAVEVAMKMALQYCRQTGRVKKDKFLTFSKAYHGDTCGAMSVSGVSIFNRSYDKMKFGVLQSDQAQYQEDSKEKWLNDFNRIIDQENESIAAIILEPLLQGAGGMIVWPIEVIKEIALKCKEKDILIIFDEVMTGFGRTGSLFAFHQVGVVPDLLCLSKGLTGGSLPLAVTIAREEIYQAFLGEDSLKMLFHGHSFTANPIACAAAVASLKLFKSENTLQKIETINKAHKNALMNFGNKIPLRDKRVVGGVGIIELDNQESYGSFNVQKLSKECFERGLFLRPLGNVIYLMPPYCTSDGEVYSAWSTIEDSLKTIFRY
jgi:adenosylmethionine-8-amino-7-oxononanoate aminotransferase